MDASASVHVPRTVLPAMAEATAYDLLRRYFGSHSHKPRGGGDSRGGTARPPSRGTTAATAATGATESGGGGSSGGHRSSSSSRHRESVRWRHSCTALWPLGVAAALGGLMSATTSEGAEEIGMSLGVQEGHARRSFPAIAKVWRGAWAWCVCVCVRGLSSARAVPPLPLACARLLVVCPRCVTPPAARVTVSPAPGWRTHVAAQDAENMLKDLTSCTRSQDGVLLEAATLFGVPTGVALSSTFKHSLMHRCVEPTHTHLRIASRLTFPTSSVLPSTPSTCRMPL